MFQCNRNMVFESSEVAQFDEEVRFCRFDDVRVYEHRDTILRNCTRGWKNNFVLYGGVSQTNNTIEVYNYLGDVGYGLSSELTITPFNDRNSAKSIFLPGRIENTC